jgi:hypothetical protein
MGDDKRPAWKKVGWFVLLWLAGVAAVAVVGALIKLML